MIFFWKQLFQMVIILMNKVRKFGTGPKCKKYIISRREKMPQEVISQVLYDSEYGFSSKINFADSLI